MHISADLEMQVLDVQIPNKMYTQYKISKFLWRPTGVIRKEMCEVKKICWGLVLYKSVFNTYTLEEYFILLLVLKIFLGGLRMV